MKKRGKIRLSVFAAALLLTLSGLWCSTAITLGNASLTLEYTYRRALNDLTDNVSGMCSVLQKAPYVNTPVLQGEVSAMLLEQSSGAKAAMAALPLSQEKTEKISRFLSQAGDYALMLSRLSAKGEKRSESDLENLAALAKYAENLKRALQDAQARLGAENASINKITGSLENTEDPDELPALDDDFDQAAKELADFPAFLYDGPFSDHIAQREALFLADKNEISREEAAEIAADFLSCPIDKLSFTGEGGDKLAVFSFTHESSHVNITKRGGIVAYFKKAAAVPSAKLGYDDALENSAEILRKMGISGFKETYYVSNDNLCTTNFAGTASLSDTEVICYPDLIKVTIELNAGGMVEYDAAGYLMNKHERALVKPQLSMEQAAESISELLTVKSARLAVIPTPGLDEVLCWEFKCASSSGQEFLVYINCETGLEEQLYLLQKSKNGTLVI